MSSSVRWPSNDVTLFRVVSVTSRELVNEAERVDNSDLLGKQADCLMIHFTHRLLVCVVIGLISDTKSSGETTLVGAVLREQAFFKNRSSQVQKKSAWASTADAKCSASKGLMPASMKV